MQDANNDWVIAESSTSNVTDERLNKRYKKLLNSLGSTPNNSIPGTFKRWGETIAAYRFLIMKMLQRLKFYLLIKMQPLTGKGGILTPLLKALLESALEGELEAHLLENREAGVVNRRNRKSSKQVQTSSDSFELLTLKNSTI